MRSACRGMPPELREELPAGGRERGPLVRPVRVDDHLEVDGGVALVLLRVQRRLRVVVLAPGGRAQASMSPHGTASLWDVPPRAFQTHVHPPSSGGESTHTAPLRFRPHAVTAPLPPYPAQQTHGRASHWSHEHPEMDRLSSTLERIGKYGHGAVTRSLTQSVSGIHPIKKIIDGACPDSRVWNLNDCILLILG